MDLKDYKITLEEVLKNEKAKKILKEEFPQIYESPLLAFAKRMSIEKILEFAKGKIDKEKTEEILKRLEKL